MAKINLLNQYAVSRSACVLDWITKNGMKVFEKGKIYTHANTSELAIKGEHGIVMWMNKENYSKHFG